MEENVVETEKKLAKVETDLNNIKELLLDIKGELRGLNQTYIPRPEMLEMLRGRDEKIAELKEEVKELKEENNKKRDRTPNWISTIIAIAALIYSFYNK